MKVRCAGREAALPLEAGGPRSPPYRSRRGARAPRQGLSLAFSGSSGCAGALPWMSCSLWALGPCPRRLSLQGRTRRGTAPCACPTALRQALKACPGRAVGADRRGDLRKQTTARAPTADRSSPMTGKCPRLPPSPPAWRPAPQPSFGAFSSARWPPLGRSPCPSCPWLRGGCGAGVEGKARSSRQLRVRSGGGPPSHHPTKSRPQSPGNYASARDPKEAPSLPSGRERLSALS